MKSLVQPDLYGRDAALVVPVQLAIVVVVLLAAVALALPATRVRDTFLARPGLDVVPVVVLVDAAAVELEYRNVLDYSVLSCTFCHDLGIDTSKKKKGGSFR